MKSLQKTMIYTFIAVFCGVLIFTGCQKHPTIIHIKITPKCSNGTSNTGTTCDGSATAAASGGIAPYTYAWSNGQTGATATGLCPGTYCVTVKDAVGLTSKQCVTIVACNPQPGPIHVSITHKCSHPGNTGTVLCDGSATATATGGAAPYTYSWDNGQTGATATGLCPGTYCVVVKDAAGLTAKQCINIPVCSPPPGQLHVGVTPKCSHGGHNSTVPCDGSASAMASGGTAPYMYSWDNGQTSPMATGLCPGTYCVMVKDAAGLTAKQCIMIAACKDSLPPPPPGFKLTFSNTCCHMNSAGAMCDGTSTVNVSGGTAPYTYLWSDGQTTQTAKGLCAGKTYTVTVTDANGLKATASVTIMKCQ